MLKQDFSLSVYCGLVGFFYLADKVIKLADKQPELADKLSKLADKIDIG
ncbi:hypothetical protein [Bacillus sp. FJAT-29937]|nr:hypothetical protein [Bacillus sp. FJAT-29937]